MATTPGDRSATGWPARLTDARLHFVTGKGGTGKTTVAAALALTLAAGGRRVLLVEVEGRQGIAQLFDVPPLPYEEVKVATAEGGGHVNALAIEIEAAFLEYLEMFYNLGIEAAIRMDRKKRPAYDAIVVDSPPTGRIARFLDVTKAVADLATGGPVHSQAESVVKLLHSEQTAIHLVTLLEALPIQETIEAIEELEKLQLPIGAVIVNRNIPPFLPPGDLAKAAKGEIDAAAVRSALSRTGIKLSDADFAGLLTETIEHASRISARSESARELEKLRVPRLELPTIADGVDLGSLYELAEVLAQQGVR